MNKDYIKNINWKISSNFIDYPEALSYMEKKVMDIINGKEHGEIWCLEHCPIYTAGVSAKKEDLLDANLLPIYQVNRGGKYTYHGPGQLVVYFMLDLKKLFYPNEPDIRVYVKLLEDLVISSLAKLGIKGEKREGRIGIWVVNQNGKEEKIAAIGIKVKKWVSYHGISININPNLDDFKGIIPCGISDFGVTSVEKLEVKVNKDELIMILKQSLIF